MFRVKIQLPKELVGAVRRAHQDRRPRRRVRQGHPTPRSGPTGCRNAARRQWRGRVQRGRRVESLQPASRCLAEDVAHAGDAHPRRSPVVSGREVTPPSIGKRRGARRHLARYPARHHGRHHRPRRRRQIDAAGPDRRLQEDAAGQVTVLGGDIADAGIGARSARGSPTCPRAWARTSTWSSASATTSTSWRGSSGCRAPERRTASTSCSMPRASARSPIVRPASSRAG